MATSPEDLFLPTSSEKFRDPFLMQSNAFIPKDLASALDFALFLYHLNPQYKRASQRVAAHFVTDIDFTGEQGDQKERDALYDFLRDGLDIFGAMLAMGEEWACFGGDTSVPTLEGVFPIRELSGRTVSVLNRNGNFVPAKFGSYGKQRIYELVLKDGQKFKTTAAHRWEVRNSSGKMVTKTTAELNLGCTIPRSVAAARPEKNADYLAGVRHGFILGDGTKENQHKPWTTTRAYFAGEKDKALFPFFEDHHNEIRQRTDETRYEMNFQCGHPGHYKDMPAADASPSYWYGFVCGFMAADGHADKRDGCVSISQARRDRLEAVMVQLPRLGMVATSLGGPYEHDAKFSDKNGAEYVCEDCEYHVLRLARNFMVEDDFIIPSHRENFKANMNPGSSYGQHVGISSIKDTGEYEEVFCCEEPITHTFTIGNGVLTSNCYGNSFVRIFFPFDRFLIDRRNNRFNEYSLGAFGNSAKFDLTTMTYEIPDPLTAGLPEGKRKRVSLPFIDRRSLDTSRIKLRMIDPRQINLDMAWQSGHTRYVYRFEEWFIRHIKEGKLHQVNQTPIDMLKAIKNNEDFMFNDGSVFHCKAPTVSGISNNGWGLPETIVNYRSLHNLQIYRCIDESIGLDFMLPFRLFSPAGTDSLADPSMYTNLGVWSSQIEKLIKGRRKDPTKMMAFPFPVNYQEFGANGKQLTPKELIEYSTNEMLDGMGYPSELFRGSLQVQQIPTTLRLFENTFHFLHRHYDGLLRWVTKRTMDYLGMEQIGVSLQLPSMADDLEQRHIYLQLAAGGEISRSKAYKPFNVKDPVQEAIERMQEDIEIQREQQKIQEDFQREMSAGSADQIMEGQAQGGGAPGQGGGGNTTPLDIMSQAEDLAKQWLEVQDNGQRSKLMKQTQSSNPTLHAMAKQKMEEYRAQGASQGRASVSQGGGEQQAPPQ